MALERTALVETRWKQATTAFALFVVGVIIAADVGSPLLDIVRYLPAADFTGHMVLIGTLAFLAGGWSPAQVRLRLGWLSRGAAVVALLVLAEELSQIWLPHRTFSFVDLAADAVGIVLAECLRRAAFERVDRLLLSNIAGRCDGSQSWRNPRVCGRIDRRPEGVDSSLGA